MPWCPKCKTEYRPGIKTCADCGSELVDELELDDANDEIPMPVVEEPDEIGDENEQYHKLLNTPASSYVKKEDKYKDLNSTFQVFLVFGILMIIFDILNMAGVFHLFTSWLQHVVILATSVAFIYVAFHSKVQAKRVHSEIGVETNITESIQEWLSNHMSKSSLQAMYKKDLTKEENFLYIVDCLKEQITEEFPGADEALVDEIIEEYYDQYMES